MSLRNVGVIGAIHLDRIAHADRQFKPDTSTPGEIMSRAGGVGANIARAMARLGMQPVMNGCLGDDADGAFLAEILSQCGIDTSSLNTVKGGRTGSYLALHNPDGTLFCAISDSEITSKVRFGKDNPIPQALLNCDIWLCETNLEEDTLAALTNAKGHRLLAADTVSIAKAPKLRALLPQIDILFTNKDEATALLNCEADSHSNEVMAKMLAERGAKTVVVSNSSKPLALYSGGTTSMHEPFAVTPTDVTGAGDAFIAGFLYANCLDETPHAAVSSGLAAASITVEATGAAPETLSPHSLQARLLEHA
ncbi:PfkB family carbohydrate kinase [Pseudovibrio sp. Tun.PSC04-5.I4]|uniref:carbohydrate kinase family protein n=1 Tax=Pseudovibrio sp. Tun.PSC04-5.I4 TaxID=1798213 RepID=UPI00087E40E6|nr:PfkB family carbohydrate kinase [Pseudovibrio sp. Tun.PSC04-5.I4]SDR37232.1 pseudouridine kinase [Pseudovibrio sp. Tun.PSC04-5.I4]